MTSFISTFLWFTAIVMLVHYLKPYYRKWELWRYERRKERLFFLDYLADENPMELRKLMAKYGDEFRKYQTWFWEQERISKISHEYSQED